MGPEPSILLFDIPSNSPHKPWNPNAWKARIVLNYKQIPYKTVWLSYPDIEPTLKKLGATPRAIDPTGSPHYMLPALLDTSPKHPVVVTDSLEIAEYLDATYPARPIFPPTGKALEYAFEESFNRILGPLLSKMMLPLAWRILDKRSRKYLRDTRERWLAGKKKKSSSAEKWRPDTYITEKDWEMLKDAFATLAGFMDKNGPGATAYVAGGKDPTRADMIIVSYLASVAVAAPERWETDVTGWDGGRWEKLWRASESWRVVK